MRHSLGFFRFAPAISGAMIFVCIFGGRTAAAAENADQNKPAKAKLQLAVPSTHRMVREGGETQFGRLFQHIQKVSAAQRAERADVDEPTAAPVMQQLLDQVAEWPDMSLQLAVYPPDVAGQPRWAIEVGLPVGQVHDLISDILSTDSDAGNLLDGMDEHVEDGTFLYKAGDRTMARLVAHGTDRCLVQSHAGVGMPEKVFRGAPGVESPVVACRLEFQETEANSGATFVSSFRLIKFVDYTSHIDADGVWQDKLRAGWPMISWLTLKAIVGAPRQTFYVPDDAFLAGVVEINGASSGLEQSLGLNLEGSTLAGPVQEYGDGELLITLLPGVGFLPVPEIVTQCRLLDGDAFLKDAAARIRRLNRQYKKKDLGEPWHDVSVNGRRVFWCDMSHEGRGQTLPFKLRPVIFVHDARDAQDREQEFLVAGWTTTNPRRFVQRWLERERDSTTSTFLPTSRSNNVEAWIRWQEVYDWVHPYVNLSLSGASADAILTDELMGALPDAKITGQIKMGGLIVQHEGPLPLGTALVPAMLSAGFRETKNSDIARERIARRHLKVLHHHATLFHQDTGRWPVSVAELDGYIDFAGNKHLLEIRETSRQQFGKLFSKLFNRDDKEEEEEEESDDEEEALYDVDDSIYEVLWLEGDWQLGFASGQLEHLDRLYIDRRGEVHRVEKVTDEDDDR